MSNENETVEQVCDILLAERRLALRDRILAAHKRELAEKDAEIVKLRECLKEAVEWSCGNPDENCGDCVAHGGDTPCKCEKWRKALEGGAEDSENNLRALVKDLADVAERFVSCKATECETVCGVGAKCIHKKAIALVARAREVLNG